MLKNLTVTQADKDENFFYLGWVYLKQEYVDSAKATFNKGLAVNPKSALNTVGLGAVAHMEKDNAGTTNYFNQAILLAGKSSKPYLYAGLAYLFPLNGSTSVGAKGPKIEPANADAAIAILTKGKTVNPKDAEVFLALGDAYRSQLNSTDAYGAYSQALILDPKLAAADVATGVLWRFADNFSDSEGQFKAALAIDPNFGPAYREWAETDIRWAFSDPTQHDAKVKDAVDNYKKYISLTDYSVESQMRYADFLISAKDYVTLQKVASDLTKFKSNLRVYRYLGYAALENKDYPAGVTAMNKWVTEAESSRIIPRDYLTLAKLQIGLKQDSLGVISLKKALSLDTSQVDLYGDIAKSMYALNKYSEAGDAYHTYGEKSKLAKLTDHFYEGLSYYLAFSNQKDKLDKDPTFKLDSSLLAKSDSAFTYVDRKATKPSITVVQYHAYVKEYEDFDRNNIKGYAKPYYEQYIQLILAKGPVTDDKVKQNMVNAYVYLGNYAEKKDKDDAKALEDFNKAKDLLPDDPSVKYYFATHKDKATK